MAAKSANELDALRKRVAELEKQIQELHARETLRRYRTNIGPIGHIPKRRRGIFTKPVSGSRR